MQELIELKNPDDEIIGVASARTKVVATVDAHGTIRSAHVVAHAQWEAAYRHPGAPSIEATALVSDKAVKLAVERLLAAQPPKKVR